MSCCSYKLVAEDGDNYETQMKGNVRRWSPLESNGSKDLTVDSSVFVIVNCKVRSRDVSMCAVNRVIDAKPVCIHYHVIVFTSGA